MLAEVERLVYSFQKWPGFPGRFCNEMKFRLILAKSVEPVACAGASG